MFISTNIAWYRILRDCSVGWIVGRAMRVTDQTSNDLSKTNNFLKTHGKII